MKEVNCKFYITKKDNTNDVYTVNEIELPEAQKEYYFKELNTGEIKKLKVIKVVPVLVPEDPINWYGNLYERPNKKAHIIYDVYCREINPVNS